LINQVEQDYLAGLSPVQIIILTCLLLIAIKFAIEVIGCLRKLTLNKLKEKVFRFALYIPQVKAYADAE
jgi:hypothetical protein